MLRVEQFSICLGVIVTLLSILWKYRLWVEVLRWIDLVWSSKECVCCVCDPNVHLNVPFIDVVCVCHIEDWELTGGGSLMLVQDDVCENSVGSVYVSGYCGLSESGLLCLQ